MTLLHLSQRTSSGGSPNAARAVSASFRQSSHSGIRTTPYNDRIFLFRRMAGSNLSHCTEELCLPSLDIRDRPALDRPITPIAPFTLLSLLYRSRRCFALTFPAERHRYCLLWNIISVRRLWSVNAYRLNHPDHERKATCRVTERWRQRH